MESGLIKKNFNVGLDHAGADLGQPTSYFVGCALNPTPQDAEPEDMVSLRMWFEANRVLTLRHRPIAAVRDSVAQLQAGGGDMGAARETFELADKLSSLVGAPRDDERRWKVAPEMAPLTPKPTPAIEEGVTERGGDEDVAMPPLASRPASPVDGVGDLDVSETGDGACQEGGAGRPGESSPPTRGPRIAAPAAAPADVDDLEVTMSDDP